MTADAILAIDCHAHVIDPARFATVAGAGYQPRPDEAAPRAEYWKALTSNGVSHGVLVQPSCYAFDNRALLDAIARAEGHAKGIAVVREDVTDAALDALETAGIVGVRLNLGAFDPDFFERAGARSFVERMRDRGLFVQVYASSAKWERIAPIVGESGASVIVDHMGEPDVAAGLSQPGFRAVLDLGRTGGAYVKLSAPYRISQQRSPFADVVPFARACIQAFGLDRCMWGSDFPFLNTANPTSYADQRAWLAAVLPDAVDRQRVLVDTPDKLFGFSRRGVR